jgi:hypothetical protein
MVFLRELEPGFTSSLWNFVNLGKSVRVDIVCIEPQLERIGLSMKKDKSS